MKVTLNETKLRKMVESTVRKTINEIMDGDLSGYGEDLNAFPDYEGDEFPEANKERDSRRITNDITGPEYGNLGNNGLKNPNIDNWKMFKKGYSPLKNNSIYSRDYDNAESERKLQKLGDKFDQDTQEYQNESKKSLKQMIGESLRKRLQEEVAGGQDGKYWDTFRVDVFNGLIEFMQNKLGLTEARADDLINVTVDIKATPTEETDFEITDLDFINAEFDYTGAEASLDEHKMEAIKKFIAHCIELQNCNEEFDDFIEEAANKYIDEMSGQDIDRADMIRFESKKSNKGILKEYGTDPTDPHSWKSWSTPYDDEYYFDNSRYINGTLENEEIEIPIFGDEYYGTKNYEEFFNVLVGAFPELRQLLNIKEQIDFWIYCISDVNVKNAEAESVVVKDIDSLVLSLRRNAPENPGIERKLAQLANALKSNTGKLIPVLNQWLNNDGWELVLSARNWGEDMEEQLRDEMEANMPQPPERED